MTYRKTKFGDLMRAVYEQYPEAFFPEEELEKRPDLKKTYRQESSDSEEEKESSETFCETEE